MTGPFPGMDPYLECQTGWSDFHHGLIYAISSDLGERLPESYVARIDERFEIATANVDRPSFFQTDVRGRHVGEEATRLSVSSPRGASATPEPMLVEILARDPEEIRITCVEIRALPELELVTTVEVLSPINKSWQGRGSYLGKRQKLHASRVNLVEIDLLLEGAPLPMKQRIEPGAYYAIVSRGARLPVAEVYRWTIRDPLPSLPIPLREPDPEFLIDLGALVNRVYELGRYPRTLRHGRPLPDTMPLTPEDRAWAEAMSVGRDR